MTSDPPVYLEQPRQRWLRPDAWRFAPPNAPERPVWARGYQEPAWLQAQRDRETLAELKAEEAQVEADARAIRLELASMRHELALLKRERKAQWQREIAARREANERAFQRVRAYLLGKANFNPEQPRDDHGRWTDAGGDFPGHRSPGRGNGANTSGNAAGTNDPRVLSDATPDPIRPGQQFAQNDPDAAARVQLASDQNDGIVEFSPNRAGWHDYTTTNLICSAEQHCSREEIADQLARFSVPGRDPVNPVSDGETSFVRDPRSGLPAGYVTTTIENDGLTVRNRTLPGHIFHDGIITRQARQADDGSWSVTTHGFGNNVIPGMATLNQQQGPLIFNEMDRRLRGNIERHRGKGILALANCGVVGGSDACRYHAVLGGVSYAR